MSGEAVELMCRVGICETIRIAAGSARTKGDVFTHQDGLAFADDDFAATDEVVGVVIAPHALVPKAGVTVVAGQDAYFAAGSPGSFTNVAGSNRKCGWFKQAAALSAATAEIYFNGYGS